MSKSLILAVLLAGLPVAAHAQDTSSSGASAGTGGASAGTGGGAGQTMAPLGSTVGSDSGLTGTNAAAFRRFVLNDQHVPSYEWLDHPNAAVGDVLPYAGVHYYNVPQEYGTTRYRYTVVNRQPVLVDPTTHQIVQVLH